MRAEQVSVFLIADNFDENEMYDTKKKRSLDLSEYKKQRQLKFENLPTLFQVLYQTKEIFNITRGSSSVSSKHEAVNVLKQYNESNFPAVENNQYPHSGFLET